MALCRLTHVSSATSDLDGDERSWHGKARTSFSVFPRRWHGAVSHLQMLLPTDRIM